MPETITVRVDIDAILGTPHAKPWWVTVIPPPWLPIELASTFKSWNEKFAAGLQQSIESGTMDESLRHETQRLFRIMFPDWYMEEQALDDNDDPTDWVAIPPPSRKASSIWKLSPALLGTILGNAVEQFNAMVDPADPNAAAETTIPKASETQLPNDSPPLALPEQTQPASSPVTPEA